MGNSPNNDVGLLHVLAQAGQLAGGAMSVARIGGEDRLTEVDNGRTIGKMQVQIDFTVGPNSNGFYEVAAIKYERSTSVPVIGTAPVPTSADIGTNGLQQEVRSNTPGYVIYFDTIAITPETNRSKKLTLNWAKYGKAVVRDGDFYAIIMFNRTNDSTTVYDIQTRYKTYTVK